MIHLFRHHVRRVHHRVWLALLGLGLLILVIVAIPVQPGVSDPAVLQATINAAATQTNVPYPTLRTELTLTPFQAIITQNAPTLALEGLSEVQQFAAAASADSARGPVDWSASQAAGPPNTKTCGDARTAWATLNPNGPGTLTALFPQIVIPTRVRVYQSFNPGYIVQIAVLDLYGKLHLVYTSEPAPSGVCPAALTVEIKDADYGASTVIVQLDQAKSPGGWDEIDAVELIGTKYN